MWAAGSGSPGFETPYLAYLLLLYIAHILTHAMSYCYCWLYPCAPLVLYTNISTSLSCCCCWLLCLCRVSYSLLHGLDKQLYRRTAILTVYTITLFADFCNDIYSHYIFSRIIFSKMFILLERKCNKLQFGLEISSIEVSKQKLRISTSLHMSTTKTPVKKSLQELLLPGEHWCQCRLLQRMNFQT